MNLRRASSASSSRRRVLSVELILLWVALSLFGEGRADRNNGLAARCRGRLRSSQHAFSAHRQSCCRCARTRAAGAMGNDGAQLAVAPVLAAHTVPPKWRGR